MHRADVFRKVLVRETTAGGAAGLAHVWWEWDEGVEVDAWLVQVYVDGRLMEVSGEDGQRSTWLWLERSVAREVRLLAVERGDPWALPGVWPEVEVPGEMSFVGQPMLNAAAEVAVLRDTALPVESRIAIELNEDSVSERWLWDDMSGRSGFGGLFGEGGFGMDAATGPGLGGGELGMGPLGGDGQAWRWRSAGLVSGAHAVRVQARGPGERVMDEQTFELEAVSLMSGWQGKLRLGEMVFSNG